MNSAALQSIESLEAGWRLLLHDRQGCTVLARCLSHIEHVGAKWILSLRTEDWSHEVHDHLRDEHGHARWLADAARRQRDAMTPDELWAEHRATSRALEATQLYMDQLIRQVFRLVAKAPDTDDENKFFRLYTLVSFLIERRGLKIYPHAASEARSEDLRKVARRLVADERSHFSFVMKHFHSIASAVGVTARELIELEEDLIRQYQGKLLAILGSP